MVQLPGVRGRLGKEKKTRPELPAYSLVQSHQLLLARTSFAAGVKPSPWAVLAGRWRGWIVLAHLMPAVSQNLKPLVTECRELEEGVLQIDASAL
jgi:hypothetical protein